MERAKGYLVSKKKKIIMISAVILCRVSSSRLPHKHFMKVGDKSIIDIILNKLLKNKNITEIVLATGIKKNNKIFEKRINKAFKSKIIIYYHKNETKVTERIKSVSENIKNKYLLVISGDCPLIDNSYIDRLYNKIIKQKKIDFVIPNQKTIHEGIFLTKTKSWKKINNLSKNKFLQEHPGSVTTLKKNLFKKCYLRIYKNEIKNNYRISVDTKSDINYLNFLNKLKKKKEIEPKEVFAHKFLKILNSHVEQRKIFHKYETRVLILTKNTKSNLSLAKFVEREISETITPNIKIIKNNNIKLLYKYEKYKNIIIVINPDYMINYFKQKKVLTIKNDSNKDDYFKIHSKYYKNKIIVYKDRATIENKLFKIKKNYLKNYKKTLESINLIGCPLFIKNLKYIIKKNNV